MDNIAFVASTLPYQHIKDNHNILHIKKIYAPGHVYNSFKNLSQKGYLDKIKVNPLFKSRIMSAFQIFILFFLAKIKGSRIIFFHECSWGIFDILIHLLQPKGAYIPIVGLDALEKDKNYRNKIIDFFWFGKCFSYYRMPNEGGNGFRLTLKSDTYPKSIKINSTKIIDLSNVKGQDDICLLIISTDFIETKLLEEAYMKIIKILKDSGYKVYIKDHPNPDYRLNLNCNVDLKLDPLIPIEALEINPSAVIGYGSTALVYFGYKAISIIDLFDDNKTYREGRKKHFNFHKNKSAINFPSNLDEISDIIKALKHNF